MGGGDMSQFGIGPARDIVDDTCAKTQHVVGHLRVGRVDGHDRSQTHRMSDGWFRAINLLLGVHRLASWSRGLCADVEDVRSLLKECFNSSLSLSSCVESAPIRK